MYKRKKIAPPPTSIRRDPQRAHLENSSGLAGRQHKDIDEASGVIGEVKNAHTLSYMAQLNDYVFYSQRHGIQSDLYVRGSTRLSGPLQQAVDDGLINLWRWLPG